MWSGGITVEAARTELEQKNRETLEANDRSTQKHNELNTAGEGHAEAHSKTVLVQGDLTTAESQATGAKNAMESAQDAVRQNENSIYEQRSNLWTEFSRAEETRKHAFFANAVWRTECERDLRLSMLEAIEHSKLMGFECIRVMHATNLKDFDATNGTKTSAQILFNMVSPLGHREARVDQGIQLLGQHAAALNSAIANAAALNQRSLNTYLKTAEHDKTARWNKASRDKDAASRSLDSAKKAEEAAKKGRDRTRVEADAAARAAAEAKNETDSASNGYYDAKVQDSEAKQKAAEAKARR